MSTEMRELASVAEADRRHKEAAKALVAAMERALPVGMYVEIPRGNGYVRGTVEGHGCWWSDPTSVFVKSLRSGSVVRCTVGHMIPRTPDA